MQSWPEKSSWFLHVSAPLGQAHCSLSYFNHQGRNFRGVFPRKAQLLQSSSKGPLPFSRLKMAEAQKGPYELIPYQRAFSSVSVFNWHGSSSPKRSSKFQERRDDISPDHNEYNL